MPRLTTADRFTFFRMMAGQVAQRFGATATFMAKPFATRTGSGAHLHYHLADARSGTTLSRPPDPRGLGLSKLAYHFLGGVLAHAPARRGRFADRQLLQATASRSRLTGSRSGFTWVPAFITYGDNNRTQMLRICEPGRVEDRTVSSACNPYLTLAAYLARGSTASPGAPTRANRTSATFTRPGCPPWRNADQNPAAVLSTALDYLEGFGHPQHPRPDRHRVPPSETRRGARVSCPGRVVGTSTLPKRALRPAATVSSILLRSMDLRWNSCTHATW